MNVHSYNWRVIASDHTLFTGYRWASWLLAIVAVTLFGLPAENMPSYAGLLLLTAVWNVVATALELSYIRLMRRRPFLASLDLLASAALVWLSKGHILPFYPYALGALILPALLLSWRGALIAGLSFVALDQVILLSVEPALTLSFGALLGRALTPVTLTLALTAFVYARHHWQHANTDQVDNTWTTDEAVAESPPPSPLNVPMPTDFSRADEPKERRDHTAMMSSSVMAPLMAIQAATQRTQEMRRTVANLMPGGDVEFTTALCQFVKDAGSVYGIDMQISITGKVTRISPAQRSILSRLAQETLLNIQQHSRARHVSFTLDYGAQAVSLTVQDNGVGLLDGTYERPGFHALRALNYRLAELEGSLDVFEGDSGGVIVCGRLPLQRP